MRKLFLPLQSPLRNTICIRRNYVQLQCLHLHKLGVFQRPLTLILQQKYRDTNGRRIVIQIGGVYTTFCQKEGILLQKYAIEMGGVSRYFSKVSGSGVDVTLLNKANLSLGQNICLIENLNLHIWAGALIATTEATRSFTGWGECNCLLLTLQLVMGRQHHELAKTLVHSFW